MRKAPWSLLGFIILLVLAVPTYLMLGPDLFLAPGGTGRLGFKQPPAPRALTAVKLKLFRVAEKKVVEIDLEDYVKGVVAGEMPSGFEIEALKAQAVLARTYALRRMRVFGGPGCERHAEADLCDDNTNQVYHAYEDFKNRLGYFAALTAWRKIEGAVRATQGLMVTYEGAPIEALYHSTSAGVTEDAAEVWGKSYSYLKPVTSNDTSSPRYRDRAVFTWKELAARLGTGDSSIQASTGGSAIQVVDRTAGGRVRTVRLGERILSGKDLREKLGLRSTNFEITRTGEGLAFDTLGFGHGVGLSQFGANERAQGGQNFVEIISYYYSGVRVTPIFTE